MMQGSATARTASMLMHARTELERRVAELDALERDDPRRPAAQDAVIGEGLALLDLEERAPGLVAAAELDRTMGVTRWTGLLTVLVASGGGLAAAAGVVPRWWLLLFVPVVLVGLGLPRLALHPAAGPHQRQRVGPVVVALGTVVAAVGASLGAVPGPVAAVAVVLVALGLGLVVVTAPPGVGSARAEHAGDGTVR